MNRTRVILLVVLAVCLAILIASLAGQEINASLLLQVYVAATIFGVGVIIFDFVGLLDHSGISGHDFGTLGQHGVDTLDGADGGHDVGHADMAAGDHMSATGNGHGADHDGAAVHHAPSEAGHAHAETTPIQQTTTTVLSVLVYLRLAVYFCLGFGPAGWVALASGRTPLSSLAIAIPIGALAVLLARAFFSFQRKDTGAVGPENNRLTGEHGTVLVPLDDQTMGKVRVQSGMNVTEVYARAADAGHVYERGEEVRVVRVMDDCVLVR